MLNRDQLLDMEQACLFALTVLGEIWPDTMRVMRLFAPSSLILSLKLKLIPTSNTFKPLEQLT